MIASRCVSFSRITRPTYPSSSSATTRCSSVARARGDDRHRLCRRARPRWTTRTTGTSSGRCFSTNEVRCPRRSSPRGGRSSRAPDLRQQRLHVLADVGEHQDVAADTGSTFDPVLVTGQRSASPRTRSSRRLVTAISAGSRPPSGSSPRRGPRPCGRLRGTRPSDLQRRSRPHPLTPRPPRPAPAFRPGPSGAAAVRPPRRYRRQELDELLDPGLAPRGVERLAMRTRPGSRSALPSASWNRSAAQSSTEAIISTSTSPRSRRAPRRTRRTRASRTGPRSA